MPPERSSQSSSNEPRRAPTDKPAPQSRYLQPPASRTRSYGAGRPAAHSPQEPPPRPSRPIDRRELIIAGSIVLAGGITAGTWLALRDGDDAADGPPASTATSTEPDVAIPGSPTADPNTTPVPTSIVQVDASEALVESSIDNLAIRIGRRELSSRALVEAAERRVTRYDNLYGAIMEMNPDAPEIARQLDDELALGHVRGPLHGVPVLLKDIFATGDGMRTTAGALALEENDVAEDATIVRRLREAGAVILGKTNMTEWSNVRAGGQTAGWSDRGGQTRNPYNPVMSTWGSSSGSAAAVALSYAPAALGAETNGSIICPAAACGVVGMKPTVGLVSRVGVMPVTRVFDSPGPMARSVADIAAVMNVIAGYDPDDPSYGDLGWTSPASTTGGSPVHEFDAVDYTESLDPDALRGARLGICWQLWGMDPEADEVGQQVIEQLRRAGAEIVEGVEIASLAELDGLPSVADMVNAEFAAGTARFFERYMPGAPVASIQEVVDWNIEHADVALEVSGQEGLIEAIDAMSLDDPVYLETVGYVVETARRFGMDAAMDEYELDAIIAPTAPVPTEITIGDGTAFAGSSAKAASLAGYPSITVPMGSVSGLPVGLHICGRAFSEQTLIRLAYSAEQLLQARVPPRL